MAQRDIMHGTNGRWYVVNLDDGTQEGPFRSKAAASRAAIVAAEAEARRPDGAPILTRPADHVAAAAFLKRGGK